MEFKYNINNFMNINNNFNDVNSDIELFKKNLKNISKYKNIYDLFSILKRKDFYLFFILFHNFEKWININFENNNNIGKRNKFETIINYIKANNDVNSKIHSIFINWIFYLYRELIMNFNSNLKLDFRRINIIKYSLKQTFDLIMSLFKCGIIKDIQMFDFIYLIYFFIESNFLQTSFSDKIHKTKNFILFKELFNLLTGIFIEINNNINDSNNQYKKGDEDEKIISNFFGFLEEFKNNEEITSFQNKSILINSKIILIFMKKIFEKINLKFIKIIESKYIDIFSAFFEEFIKHNYKKSNIYEILLYFLKQSFINLYYFEKNKNKIIQDLFINNFYSNFLRKIFFKKEILEENKTIPMFDCFYFNGNNSQIELNIQNANFEKSSLFFSFNLSPIKGRLIYPLFLIQKNYDNKKEEFLKLYLQKDEKENYFFLNGYFQNEENKLNYEIKSNFTYYLCVCFKDDEILIKIYETYLDKIISFPIKKNSKLLSKKSLSLTFGFYRKRTEVFSGYIGPIIILSNPKQVKLIDEFIKAVLKLGYRYKNYIHFCLNMEFIEQDEMLFQIKEKEIKYKLDKVECLLYLIPQNFRFFNEHSSVINQIPIDDNFCAIQESYNIQNLNVSIVKYKNDIYEFIRDNGLDYICLLYEYINQFAEHFFNSGQLDIDDIDNNKDIFLKYITSIFKETLFIIEKIYHEVKLENFIKNLKQIYMNLFSCLNIIANHSNIIEDLINTIFDIMDYYHNYFSEHKNCQIISENKINNSIFQTNLSFMNGWVDFLLNPEIYNFDNKETLISLFNHLSTYFSYIAANKPEDKINQNLYLKLINFKEYLDDNSNNLEQDIKKNDDEFNDKKNEINLINKNNDEKNNVLNVYFKALQSFYEKNPSKTENINNIKNMFKDINEKLSKDDKSFYISCKFINKCVKKDVDRYFHEDENDEHIFTLIKIANKIISLTILKDQENKDKKEILNKSQTFDELINDTIYILFRIIFTKERLNKDNKIIKRFIIKNYEKSKALIPIMFDVLRMVFIQYLLRTPNEENKSKDKKKITKEIYSSAELHVPLKFYNEIFNLIRFVLEEINPKINEIDKINNENIIVELFEYTNKMIKLQLHESKIVFSNNSKDNYINFKEIIFHLINFLKFYHNILFTNIYSERFINNFIDLCDICLSSGLIYSTILIEVEENSCIKKTTLEIILDICIKYIVSSTNEYFQEPFNGNIDKKSITNEQTTIHNFLNLLFPIEKNKDKNEEIKKRYVIFYINDYLRYLLFSFPKVGKKRPKNDPIYDQFIFEFNNLQNIEELFSKEQKFNLNFTTFFMIKCQGYSQLLCELKSKFTSQSEKEKSQLKLDDILLLFPYTINKIYEAQELLNSKSKNFFSPKNLHTDEYYVEVKKLMESIIIKKIRYYQDLEDYILNKIYKNDFEKVFTLIHSDLCLIKRNDPQEEKKSKKIDNYQEHINIQKENQEENNNLVKANTYKESALKKLINEISPESDSLNTERNKEGNDSDPKTKELILNESTKHNINEDNSTNDLTGSSSNNDKNEIQKKKTSNKSIHYPYSRRMSTLSFISTNTNDSNPANNISYLNYFFQPDGFLLKNSKKQLMMSVFSIYFFEHFYDNKSFKLMKKCYIKNFEGIQKSTKLLNYPSKVKIFNNGLEPYLFLKPYVSFFENKLFHISHNYFVEFMKKKNINIESPIILYKKTLPEFHLEGMFDINCELIRLEHCYFGHIIGSKNIDYLIFKKQKYDFYEEIDKYKSAKKLSETSPKDLDLFKLFTLSYVNKKPLSKKSKNLPKLKKKKIFKKNKEVIILFDEIDEIIERRFLLLWQAIEIFLKNGKSYFFNFLSKEKSDFILDIFNKNEKTRNKIKRKDHFQQLVNKLIIEWQEEQLTTYEYLLFLNKFSSRTYNDVNQYPVFPWIKRKFEMIKGEKEAKPVPRDFKYPMSSQREELRKEALNRFKEDEENGEHFPVHYGNHYSTSSYIYFYLMREEPFTTLLMKLQGNKQENPDRMFYSFIDTLFILETGHDNRECIPDIFCKIEQFINLNCVDFGKKISGIRVDDFIVYVYESDKEAKLNMLLTKNDHSVSDYVNFILKENIFLNCKTTTKEITKWFDLIFGVLQLPEKNRKNCLNIFSAETYEQETNLYNLLEKEKKKYQSDLSKIISHLENKIDLIISFGQTPFQLFLVKHPKLEKKKKVEIKNINNEELEEDFEYEIVKITRPKKLGENIEIQPLFFEIYPSSGKIFLIDSTRQLQIIHTNFYNSQVNEYKPGNFLILQLPHIKFFERRKINNNLYYIIKQKYCISLFNDRINLQKEDSINPDNSFNLYYNQYLKNLSKENENEKEKTKYPKKEEIIFITCRYIDNSFKIHYIINDKKLKDKNDKNYISVICEDFVCSVCTLDHNKFLVGLKNGKLLQYSLIKERNQKNNFQIKVKLNKIIQAHKKAINVIEINFRLGVIITAGEDNYLFIRKIYDLELLTPIKFKSKFIITTAKISPLNFLYVQCFNTKKGCSIIFGYTLNGIYFAKSKYGFFDTLDFTRSGNIVTFVKKSETISLNKSEITPKNKSENISVKSENISETKSDNTSIKSENYFVKRNEIIVLNGYDLINIKGNNQEEIDKIFGRAKERICGSQFAAFNYISRRYDDENYILCITYLYCNKTSKNKVINRIESVDVSDLKMFD